MRFLVFVLGFWPLLVLSAPKAELDEFWLASQQANETTVSHQAWQFLLDSYLSEFDDGINRFAYDQVSKQDKQLLADYLAQLQALDPRALNRGEQYAYWVNLYNAATVDLVLKHYPIASIKDIKLGWKAWLGSGPWDAKILKVAGRELSLNNVEHNIIRPIWNEPRSHFVLNCASLGCPNLLPQALTADNSQTLLQTAAKDFINHPRGVQRLASGELQISSIFDWYSEDFGGEAGLRRYLLKYISRDKRNWLVSGDGHKSAYDWRLNSPQNR